MFVKTLVLVFDRSSPSYPLKKAKNVLGAKKIIFIFKVFKVLQCSVSLNPFPAIYMITDVCSLTYFHISVANIANNMDPDQTAPLGSV